MTRELSPKAGAALIRKAFTAKGASMTHTESLDLLAKLKGYESWSHLQKETSKAAKASSPVATSSSPAEVKPAPEKKEGISLKDVLIQHYGYDGELPSMARSLWKDVTPYVDYWDWVVGGLAASELWAGATHFTKRGAVGVTLPDGSVGHWNIEQNLTDRWGELNYHADQSKPGLLLLAVDRELHNRVCEQMWDEITFAVRKDGHLGLLFEVEYASIESEECDDKDAHNLYRPHEVVVAKLTSGLQLLQKDYPQVEFCVPDRNQIIRDRPAVWGFFKLDALSEEQREALGRKMLDL